jgi:hypothetical protein
VQPARPPVPWSPTIWPLPVLPVPELAPPMVIRAVRVEDLHPRCDPGTGQHAGEGLELGRGEGTPRPGSPASSGLLQIGTIEPWALWLETAPGIWSADQPHPNGGARRRTRRRSAFSSAVLRRAGRMLRHSQGWLADDILPPLSLSVLRASMPPNPPPMMISMPKSMLTTPTASSHPGTRRAPNRYE